MESINRTINYLDLEYEQIKVKILNYILMPQNYSDFIKSSKQFNIVSLGLDEIYFGYSNSKRYIISLINCLCLWITILVMILFYALYDQINQIYNLNEYFDHSKQTILLIIDGLFLAAMLKTDLIIEERKYNLRCFKIFYYLAHDLKNKHKLNDKQYKILTIFIKISNLGLKIGTPIYAATVIGLYLSSGIWKESIFVNCFALTSLYLFFITISLYTIFIDLTFIYSFYYKSLFDQINHSIKSLHEHSNYLVLNTKLLRQINEHYYVSNEIAKLNLFIRKSIATFFITSSTIIHIQIYLAIYSNKFIYKLIWSIIGYGFFFLGFGLCYLLSLISKSARQSYNEIFPILIHRKTNLRVKLRVNLN